MNIRSKKFWAGTLVTGAAAALGLGLTTTSATAESELRGDPTITMERDGDELFFSGPEIISQGQTLTIRNNTNPDRIGPHTFTLVKENLIPNSPNEFKACFQNAPESVCKKVFKAHEVDFEKEKVGKKSVEAGKDGWNVLFRKQAKGKGDSWFALNEGDEETRVVSAQPGKTLTYFCAIHPEMRGEINIPNPVK